jgi:hypothetical protein
MKCGPYPVIAVVSEDLESYFRTGEGYASGERARE